MNTDHNDVERETEYKIVGRTESTILENIPVIARDGENPEAYVLTRPTLSLLQRSER